MQLNYSWQQIAQSYCGNGGGTNVYIRLYGKLNWQSADNNRSSYSLQCRVYFDKHLYTSSIVSNIDGTSSSYGSINVTNEEVTLQEVERWHTHNDSGDSGTINKSCSWSSYYSSVNGSTNGSFTLPKINRYPVLSSGSDFTDETNPTLTFSNAGVYPVRVKLEVGGNNQLITRDILQTATSYTFDLTETERNTLRALTPNSNSLAVIETVCAMNGNTELSASYKQYTMTITNGSPVFEDFTYQDTNSAITAITGDNQAIIKGLSTLQVNIPVADKMGTQKYATPVKYVATIDALTSAGNYSSNSAVSINLGIINSAGTKRLSTRAYDSRNNSTEVYKDIVVYDYEKPIINAIAERENNFETNTTIKVSGSYSPLTINNTDKNTITNIKYRYREKNGTWGSWSNITFTVNNGNYIATDEVISLDSGKEFDIEIKVIDNLQETVVTRNIDIGQSIFFISSNKRKCYINNERVLTEVDVNNNYDTNEIDTGQKWINGEAIYRKVIEVNPTAIDNINFSHNIDNFDKLIKAYGRCTRPNGDYFQQVIPCNYANWEIYLYDVSTYGFRLRFSANQWNAGLSDIYVVLEYTKTTN